jgi:apolipoprotein D and lipocalin family protein
MLGKSKILFLTLSLLTLPLFSASAQAFCLFPQVVEQVDLTRYLGTWYEIASTKPSFQRDCVCSVANYSLTPENNVQVKNECRKLTVNGELSVAEGIATPTDDPAKLNVSFGNFRLPFANYWIVSLAADYSWAVISSPFCNPIWILSRTPQMEAKTLEGIYQDLAVRGFNVQKLIPSTQQGCPTK